MIGEGSYRPYAINTFSGKGKSMDWRSNYHHVSPHYVSSHFRKGKFISGYWRDGDGDTSVNTYRGYYARNPGAIPISIAMGRNKNL